MISPYLAGSREATPPPILSAHSSIVSRDNSEAGNSPPMSGLLGVRSEAVCMLPLAADLGWLNELLGGLVEGGIILLAGSPGSGKSRLATQIALSAATQGVRSISVLTEERPERLLKRAQLLTSHWPASEAKNALQLMELTDEISQLS